MRFLRILRRRERGQALLEFALAGIVFFLLVFGMIDAGRAVWSYNTLAEATREGTRYAIVHGADSSDPSGPGSAYYTPPNSDAMVAAEVQRFIGGLDPSLLTVESDWVDGDNQLGSQVRVTSQYTYEPMFGFLGMVSFTLTSSSTMEITH